MSDQLVIQSHKGPYLVHFDDTLLTKIEGLFESESHFLVDANVARLFSVELQSIFTHPNAIVIEATEVNKSIEKIIPVFEKLVLNNIRRGQTLVAVGGGVIQDITFFIASTLLRGLPWRFIPTTLLAQADSCIGSKSSINLGSTKNILGTFTPPQDIFICTRFLKTLDEKEIHSGVGEIIKVHAIDGAKSFDGLAIDFDRLFEESSILMKYIRSALLIKQRYIEEDEFDRGIRNIFNYGHSFGHAIESATNYSIPHGIAVSMGMDMANQVAVERDFLPRPQLNRMRVVLRKNYEKYMKTHVPIDLMLSALMKDKKNTSTMLGLILPLGDEATIRRVQVPLDDAFRSQCAKFLLELNK